MARLLGPDENSRLVYRVSGTQLRHDVGGMVTVYADAACTTLADIAAYDPNNPAVPGAAIANAQLVVGADSKLPLFWFPADGTDALYAQASYAGQLGSATRIVADLDVRVDAEAVARAAGDALAALKASNLSDLASTSAARTNLGLGSAATLSVGTTAGTVAAGDDSRIVGAAQKSANLGDLASAATARTNLSVQRQSFVDVRDYGAVGDNSTNDLVAIQSAITAAATVGAVVMLQGPHVIAGTLNLATGTILDGIQGSLRQTGTRTTALKANNVNNIIVRNVTVTGLGSDYVNNSGVYAAGALWITGTTTNVTIVGCTFTNNAGSGVYLGTSTVSKISIHNCTITGPGAPPIVGTTSNFSGGVVTVDGPNDWEVIDCDISQYAQGIVTGVGNHIRIIGNHIHNIVGQHGIYLASMTDTVVASNVIHDTVLLGMKVQIGTTSEPDATQITITGNVITDVGSHGILLTNPVGGSPRVRRVAVTGNTIALKAPATADGINLTGFGSLNVIGVTVVGNNIYQVRHGINITSSADVTVALNRIQTCTDNGIYVTNSSDLRIYQNRVIDPASAQNASTRFGIYLTGASTNNVTVDGNIVSDSTGLNMRYGLYLSGADQTTCVIRNNDFSGASDYGARLDSTMTIKEWANNVLSGALGDVTGFPTTLVVKGRPTQYVATAAPTTGTYKTGDFVWSSAPTAAAVGFGCVAGGTPGTWTTLGAVSPPDIQEFTTAGSNTWTKPAGAKVVNTILVGSGGPGGSGRRGAAGGIRCGGGGGAGGGITVRQFDAADLASSVTVTIGAGGTGGASVTTDGTNGNAGTGGTSTTFGSYASAFKGSAGSGGTTTSGLGGTGGAGSTPGTAGAPASTSGGAGGAATAAGGAGAGGSGGGITSGDIAGAGGNGTGSVIAGAGNFGTGGAVDSTAPTNGTAPTVKGSPGAGGGGGAASTSTAAQAGANGARGGGGGGGGASLNDGGTGAGGPSGAGGNGGDGYALVITYFQ